MIEPGFKKKILNQQSNKLLHVSLPFKIYLDKPVLSAAAASQEPAWLSASGAETFSPRSPTRSPGSRAQSPGPVSTTCSRVVCVSIWFLYLRSSYEFETKFPCCKLMPIMLWGWCGKHEIGQGIYVLSVLEAKIQAKTHNMRHLLISDKSALESPI